MSPPPSDAALALAWAAGQEQAYATLVERYGGMIYARCRRALPSADAEDAAQAVFLILARRGKVAAASPKLAAWLMEVARNVIRNAQRARRSCAARQQALPEQLAGPAADPDPAELRRELDTALEELPERERSAIALYFLAGHTLAEVAAHQGAPLTTIASRVQRGLERLRIAFARRQRQLAATGLLVFLLNEGRAEVPPQLAAHLYRLPLPSTTIPAAIAALARVRVQGFSSMTALILAGSGVILSGTVAVLAFSGPGREDPPPDPPASDVVTVDPVPAGDPLFDFERGQFVYRIQVHDLPRTLDRLGGAPEGLLLGDSNLAEGRAELAALGLSDLEMAVDVFAMFTPEQRRMFNEAQRVMPGGTHPSAEEARQLQRQLAESQHANPPDIKKIAFRCRIGHEPGHAAAVQARMDVLTAAIDQIRISAQAGAAPADASGRWLQAVSGARGTTIAQDGEGPLGSLAWYDAQPLPLRHAGADVEICGWYRPLAGGEPVLVADTHAQLTPQGLRLHAWTMQDPRRAGLPSGQTVDDAVLAQIPTDALAGGAVALRSGSMNILFTNMLAGFEAGSETFQGEGPHNKIVVGVDPGHGLRTTGLIPPAALTAVRALAACIDSVDGHAVLWLSPGSFLPSVQVILDCPEQPAMDLLSALGAWGNGQRGEDGTWQFLTHLGPAQAAWLGGKLYLTTNPGGVAAMRTPGTQGFHAVPDVQEALAAMQGPRWCKVVVRSEALIAQLEPLAAAWAPPQQTERIRTFAAASGDVGRAAYLSMQVDAQGMTVDASGLVAAVVAAIAASQGMAAISGMN